MFRIPVASIAILLLSAFPAYSGPSTFDITVAAGQHERINVPVHAASACWSDWQ